MDELLLFTLTSPSLQLKQTSSFLQILLTSSPLNTDGRAPTICNDEPFNATQTDGLLPSNFVDELLLFTWTSSHHSLLDELFQTARPDDLSPLTHVAELYPTTHTDEPSPTSPKDELYSPPTIDYLSHKQDA